MNYTFSQMKSGKKIGVGAGNTLFFDAGISAADVAVSETSKGVRLAVGNKFVILDEWTLDQLSSLDVVFNDGSELRVGDDGVAQLDDQNANILTSFAPATVRHDQFRGLGGDDMLDGGAGDDLLFGNAGRDILIGGLGDDILNGGVGDDAIEGGDDDDRVRIDGPDCGSDTVLGGEGNDRLLYSDAGSKTRQTLSGEAGNDIILGGRGHDTLYGGADDDRIVGGKGKDLLRGGLGVDLLKGGDKADVFEFGALDSLPALGLFDTVRDFQTGRDQFDMPEAGTDANYIEESLSTDSFAKALDRAAELMLANDGAKIYVYIDGVTRGWLFADFQGPDTIPDFAVMLRNGVSKKDLDYTDII